MSKIVRINNGDYKLSVRDSDGNLTLTTFEQNTLSNSKINLFSKDIVMNGISGQSTIVSTANSSVNLFNDTATTVNAFGDATIIDIGASTGTLTIRNADTILDGDLEVKGGDITTNQSTFNLLNTVAETINAFGTATTVNIGPIVSTTVEDNSYSGRIVTIDSTGEPTVTITGNLTVFGTKTEINASTLTVDDINIELGKIENPTDSTAGAFGGGGIILKGTTDKTIKWLNDGNNSWTSSENWNLITDKTYNINNIVSLSSDSILPSASTISIGTSGGSATIHNDSLILDGDLLVKGGDITTNTTTFNLINDTATTINAFGTATGINIGSNGIGSLFTINNETTKVNNLLLDNSSLDSSALFVDLLATPTNITAFSSGTNIDIGSTSGTLTIHNSTTEFDGSLLINGNNITIGDVIIDSTTGSISTSATGALQSKINLNVISSANGSIVVPAGDDTTRDEFPYAGYTRFNTLVSKLETFNGTIWEVVGDGNARITGDTGSFVAPSGTTAQRDALPSAGYLRYNTQLGHLEVYNGSVWNSVATGAGNATITSDTGSLVIPAGTTNERDASPFLGYFRFNSELAVFEGYDGSQWQRFQLVINDIDGGIFGSTENPSIGNVDGGIFGSTENPSIGNVDGGIFGSPSIDIVDGGLF